MAITTRTWDPNKKLVQDTVPNMTGQTVQAKPNVAATPLLKNASSGVSQTVKAQNPLTSTAAVNTAAQAPTVTAEQLAEQDRLDQVGYVNNQMKEVADVAKRYNLNAGPTTIQEAVDQFMANQEQTTKATKAELARQKTLDEAAGQRFNEQAQGSIGANNSAFAQGREGAMSGSASGLRNEFTSEINKQISENKIRLESAQAQRDQLMIELDRANREGQSKLAESIAGQLASAKQQIEQIKTNYMNSLTQANEQARLNEQSTRQNLTTFTGMVDSGATMTTEGIISMSKTLSIPFDTAFSYYQAASNIREDKKLSLEEKQVKLEDLNFNFNEKVQGIRGEQAQAVSDFSKLAKSGNYSSEQLATFASAMNIPNDMNPLYQSDIRLKAAQAAKAELDAKYAYSTPPKGTLAYLEYQEAALRVQKAELENAEYTGIVPETQLKDVFYRDFKSDYGHGVGKAECGEGANDITEGKKVSDSYASKMATVVKQDNPQVGNMLVIPLAPGGIVTNNATQPGHVETVIQTNPLTGDFKTVSWNRDGNGTESIQSYNINDLQKYKDNWGFSDSKLKPEYANKLSELKDSVGTPQGTKYGEYLQKAKEAGLKDKDAAEWAKKQTENDLVGGDKDIKLTPEERIATNQLRTQFDAQAAVKEYKQVRDQHEDFKRVVGGKYNGAGDLLMIYGFMRALDPTSVVRESEFEQAKNSGNIFEGWAASFNGAFKTGQKLPQEVRDQFMQVVESRLNTKEKAFDTEYNRYKRMAEDQGLNPEWVVEDYTGKADKEKAAAAQTKQWLDFGKSLIDMTHGETGKYVVPEEHPINNYDF